MVYAALLILGLLLSALVIIRQLSRDGIGAIVYSPITVFTAYFAVIHFLTPLLKAESGRFRYEPYYDSGVLVYSAVLSIIFFLFALFVDYINSPKTRRLLKTGIAVSRVNEFGARRTALYTGIALCLAGSYFALKDIATIRSAAGSVTNFLLDRNSFYEERSTGRIFANFLIPASGILIALLTVSSRKFFIIIIITSINVLLIYYAHLVSSRNTMLVLALTNLSVYLFFKGRKQPNRKKSGLRGWLLIGLAVTAVGWFAYGATSTRYAAGDSEYLRERRDDILFYMLDGAFGNDEARLWMAQNPQEYYFGETYLAAFTNVVPRMIWPDKPLGAGPRLVNMIRPGSYVLGETGNTSLTPGLLVEAQMNFGIPGVFVMIAIWSYCANRIVRAAIRETSVQKRVMYVIVAVALSSNLLYSEFLGFVARVGVIVFPLWLASKFEKFNFTRNSNYRVLT